MDDPWRYPLVSENLDQFLPVHVVICARHIKSHDSDNLASQPGCEGNVEKALKRLGGAFSPKLCLGQEIVLVAEGGQVNGHDLFDELAHARQQGDRSPAIGELRGLARLS